MGEGPAARERTADPRSRLFDDLRSNRRRNNIQGCIGAVERSSIPPGTDEQIHYPAKIANSNGNVSSLFGSSIREVTQISNTRTEY